MTSITTKQVQYVKVLLRQHQLIDDSPNMAMQYSNQRTTHISELTMTEGQEMIRTLTGTTHKQAEELMRRKIISMAREMGWVETVEGKLKANIGRIDSWCVQYGYLHKSFNTYTFEELQKLVTQFSNLHTQFFKEIK